MSDDLTRPIIGIENRTAQEVFDIMCDRYRGARNDVLEEAARTGYRICAETRHVTLGDKVEAAIRALKEPKP